MAQKGNNHDTEFQLDLESVSNAKTSLYKCTNKTRKYIETYISVNKPYILLFNTKHVLINDIELFSKSIVYKPLMFNDMEWVNALFYLLIESSNFIVVSQFL